MQPNVLPFRVDRYAYRADGDFWLRTVCRVCDKKYEVYAAGPLPSDDLCGECQHIQRAMNVIYGEAPRERINWRMIGGGILAIAVSTGIWWALLWAGLSGYRYVDGIVNALKEALR